MMRKVSWILPGLLLCLAGCAGPARTYVSAQRVIRGADVEAVFAEATSILQQEFGRIQVDRVNQSIISAPQEFTTTRESGTARDLYRGRSTMRRTAHFTVSSGETGAVAHLRIDLERQDTVRQQVMRPRAYRLGDAPGHETPIDRDAATTHRQNTVWTHVRRDTNLERALLDELRERIARRVAENEPDAGEEAKDGPAPRASETTE
jgi:hypothetical protein